MRAETLTRSATVATDFELIEIDAFIDGALKVIDISALTPRDWCL